MGQFLKNLRDRQKSRSSVVTCEVCDDVAVSGTRLCMMHRDCAMIAVHEEWYRQEARKVEDQRLQSKKKK